MPTTRDTAKLLDLERRVKNLSPGDQLRVAAGCIDQGEYEIAETLVQKIADELSVRRLLRMK